MKVHATNDFFVSLKKTNSFFHKYIIMSWFNFKHGISNLWKYRKIVWRTRHWDYYYILEMQKFQLEHLKNVLEKGYEEEISKNKKVIQISSCIKSIQNLLDDMNTDNTYMQKVGFDINRIESEFKPVENKELYEYVSKSPYSKEEMNQFYSESEKLKKIDIDNLYDTLKEHSFSWWN